MASYADRLESNLRSQIEVLEHIYESDKKFLETFDSTSSDLSQYDDYMEEQDTYQDDLDKLDSEYDEISRYIDSHPDELTKLPADRKKRIGDLIREQDGKIQAVNTVEVKTRKIAEEYFGNRRRDLAKSRKAARVITDKYNTAAVASSVDDSMLDVTN